MLMAELGKRKREHFKALESQVTEKTVMLAEAVAEPINPTDDRPIMESDSSRCNQPPQDMSNLQSSLGTGSMKEWIVTHNTTTSPPPRAARSSLGPSPEAVDPVLGYIEVDLEAERQQNISLPEDETADLLSRQHVSASEPTISGFAASATLDHGQTYLSNCETQPFSWTWDPLAFMPSVSVPTTPPAPDSASLENESTPPTDHSSSPKGSSSNLFQPRLPEATPSLDQAAALQTYQATHQAFTDTYSLHSQELNLIRAVFSISSLFNITSELWCLESTSPFCSANPPSLPPNLPQNLHPTALQLTTPHHPILDILPWPVTRDKLILVLALPPHLRPLPAQSETALLDFVYDVEDGSEGVRVWGDCPYREENWEVGSTVFKKWWWAFDGKIVKKSNEWRTGRGLGRLSMGPSGGSVVGEVG